MVRLSSLRSFSRRLRIWDWMETSSALTGSSAMMSLGSGAKARAMAMRWRCPPENSWGYFCLKRGSRPTRSISSAILRSSSVPLRLLWRCLMASARVELMVIRGFSDA